MKRVYCLYRVPTLGQVEKTTFPCSGRLAMRSQRKRGGKSSRSFPKGVFPATSDPPSSVRRYRR